MIRPCVFPGCPNDYTGKTGGGLCNSHYWQQYKGRELTPLSYRRNVMMPWLEEHVSHVGDGCLIWPFPPATTGYGQIKVRGKMCGAHRVMCELAHGKPPKGQEAAHSCGNGHLGCVNPKHLSWKSHSDNVQDACAMGTLRRPRLKPADVREIRTLSRKIPNRDIAAKFGTRPGHVEAIASHRVWRNI